MQAAGLSPFALALAAGWRACLALGDARWIGRVDAHRRVYRAELGWTDPLQQAARQRWAVVGLVGAGLVVISRLQGSAVSMLPAGAPGVMLLVGCTLILTGLARDRTLQHGRYTSICIGSLTVASLLQPVAPHVAGLTASFLAAQLYVVAGIRKLRSRPFLSGRVLADSLAHQWVQAEAGNKESPRVVPSGRLPAVIGSPAFLAWCRAAALATVAAELAIGVGALGLLPSLLTLALAFALHAGFLVLGPKRLVPFGAAALGLVALSTLHPIMSAIP